VDQRVAAVYCPSCHLRSFVMKIVTGKATREFTAADLSRIRR
jgi:hypothetical protein